jgi:hypothetical protein
MKSELDEHLNFVRTLVKWHLGKSGNAADVEARRLVKKALGSKADLPTDPSYWVELVKKLAEASKRPTAKRSVSEQDLNAFIFSVLHDADVKTAEFLHLRFPLLVPHSACRFLREGRRAQKIGASKTEQGKVLDRLWDDAVQRAGPWGVTSSALRTRFQELYPRKPEHLDRRSLDNKRAPFEKKLESVSIPFGLPEKWQSYQTCQGIWNTAESRKRQRRSSRTVPFPPIQSTKSTDRYGLPDEYLIRMTFRWLLTYGFYGPGMYVEKAEPKLCKAARVFHLALMGYSADRMRQVYDIDSSFEEARQDLFTKIGNWIISHTGLPCDWATLAPWGVVSESA